MAAAVEGLPEQPHGRAGRFDPSHLWKLVELVSSADGAPPARAAAVRQQVEQLLHGRLPPLEGATGNIAAFRATRGSVAALGSGRAVSHGGSVPAHLLTARRNGGAGGGPATAAGKSGAGGDSRGAPRRPLVATMVSHPVDRCLDQILGLWRPHLDGVGSLEAHAGAADALARLAHQRRGSGAGGGDGGAGSGGGGDGFGGWEGGGDDDGGGGLLSSAAEGWDAAWATLEALVHQAVGEEGSSSNNSRGGRLRRRGGIEDLLGGGGAGGAAEAAAGAPQCHNEQWRLLRPRTPVKQTGRVPDDAGEAWGMTPLLVLAQFDLVRACPTASVSPQPNVYPIPPTPAPRPSYRYPTPPVPRTYPPPLLLLALSPTPCPPSPRPHHHLAQHTHTT